MRAITKKPKPTFVIRLVGPPNLRPWDVPVRSLTRIFNAIQRLIEHTEKPEILEDEAEEPIKSASPIQLLGVNSGSAVYPVCAFDGAAALKLFGEMGTKLANPTVADWDSVTLSSVAEISAAAKAIGCTVEIRRDDKRGDLLATITPDSYADVSESAFIAGESSVFGYLERVGGATRPHCGLRIATQPTKMVICHVCSEELVRELGPYVYRNIRVSGKVTWLRKDWLVKTVDVKSFEPAKTGSICEALQEIYEAGGKAWDEVEDPEALIKGAK